MTGLEILGAIVWLIVNLIVFGWGITWFIGGCIMSHFTGNKAEKTICWIISLICLCGSTYSTHLWFNALQFSN